MSKSYKRILVTTFNEYITNSLIPGFRYLIDRNYYERICWAFLHILHIIVLICLTNYTWQRFFTSPIITWQDSFQYPVTKVPFPGVSVCSINKISKASASKMATFLGNKTKISHEKLLRDLGELGRLYDYNLNSNAELERLKQLHSILDEAYYGEKSSKPFNTWAILDKLSESCADMITDCRWKGLEHNCADLFVRELTMDGNCCVFNYPKTGRSSKILQDNNDQPLTTGYGLMYGLTAKLVTNISNYMYTTMSTVGMKILISQAGDFPDTPSGGLEEAFIPVNRIVFLKISSKTLETTKEVRKYGVDKRHCYFSDEQKTIFGDYSYSDCLMDCKIRSMVALCQCIPFMYNFSYRENMNYDQCTLMDLPCLSKYKQKWETIYPEDYQGSLFEREKQESLFCKKCVPACSETSYQMRNEVVYFADKTEHNYSLLNVYYPDSYGELLKQDVIFYWFEIVGLFGGLFSLIMGVSFISIVEILYYFTVRLYFNYVKSANN